MSSAFRPVNPSLPMHSIQRQQQDRMAMTTSSMSAVAAPAATAAPAPAPAPAPASAASAAAAPAPTGTPELATMMASSDMSAARRHNTAPVGGRASASPSQAPSERRATLQQPPPPPHHRQQHDHHHYHHQNPQDESATPTRATFAPSSALMGQKSLPTSPFTQSVRIPDPASDLALALAAPRNPRRENSHQSRKSVGESEDTEMANDSDEAAAAVEETANSDDDSVDPDGRAAGKKKKSQRFYCTDYPPCSLSFTRSEHLARHIRKHTGERPFQCHCSRRFSRLDNLRQHAQTVHVNEDIPMDSLASTLRFPRQMRVDRRQTVGRARAGTVGGGAGPIRGHSKSLSTSSISSMASMSSVYGGGFRDERRHRPSPLLMNETRSHLSLDPSYHNPDGLAYRPMSPSEFSTPASATFSTGQDSPHWAGSSMASPSSAHSRSQSMFASEPRTPGRRLSVPSSTGNPFSSPLAPILAHHGGLGPSNPAPHPFSAAPDCIMEAPPAASSVGPDWPPRDPVSEDYRRRTWHLDSRNRQPFRTLSSGSIVPATPAPQPPAFAVRLPPIASFDPLLHHHHHHHQNQQQQQHPIPASPVPGSRPAPIPVDPNIRYHPQGLQPLADVVGSSDDRRSIAQLDMGLRRGLTRLDIASSSASSTPPRDGMGSWPAEFSNQPEAPTERVRLHPPTVRFQPDTAPGIASVARALHQHTMSAPSIVPPREKRHGWYSGPQSHSPLQSSQLSQTYPSQPQYTPPAVSYDAKPASYIDRLVHPNIGFQGFPSRGEAGAPASTTMEMEYGNSTQQQHTDQRMEMESEDGDRMRRLQALVAVATSEGTKAY